MTLTLKKRISLGFGLVFIFITLFSVLNFSFAYRSKLALEINNARFDQLSIYNVFDLRLREVTLGYMDAIVDAGGGRVDDEIIKVHQDFIAFTKENKVHLENAADTPEERENIKKIFLLLNGFTVSGSNLLQAINQNIDRNRLASYDDKIDNSSSQIKELIQSSIKSVREEYREASERLYENTNSIVKSQAISLFVILLLCSILSFFIVRSANRTMVHLSETISLSALKLSSASGQLAGASQDLASGASQQASAIEETSASLEEISGMIQNNVSNSERNVDISNEVQTISEEGNSSMTSLQSSMDDILESNKKIEELVSIVSNIGEKTQIMDEIVFQTKLLSFNASVEAERAGEHGRGFAVVAQEVGNLARLSGEAAQEISLIVKDSIEKAEGITSSNKEKVEVGSSYVSSTAEALKRIMDFSQNATLGSEQILQASREQSGGIAQISSAITQLDKTIQESASSSQEVATTSKELYNLTESLQKGVAELNLLVKGRSDS